MRIWLPVGTRPEAIKMSPVARALRAQRFDVRLVATGQHGALTERALAETGERAALALPEVAPGMDLPDILAALVSSMGRALDVDRPTAVLVHGDTTSALAAALAASYRQIPLGHVEAGLRSGDVRAPFPEELNRRLIDRLSQAWFAPTPRCREVLVGEGADPRRVWVTGNPVVDALHMALAGEELPADLAAPVSPFALVTAHRRESHGEALQRIIAAVRALADEGMTILWPVHPNPSVEPVVYAALSEHPRVHITPPLPYHHFVHLLARADLVLTDSGGVQEEASCLGRPTIVLRQVTERPEVFDTGVVLLAGTETERIVSCARAWLAAPPKPTSSRPLGEGRAGGIIAERVSEWLGYP